MGTFISIVTYTSHTNNMETRNSFEWLLVVNDVEGYETLIMLGNVWRKNNFVFIAW